MTNTIIPILSHTFGLVTYWVGLAPEIYLMTGGRHDPTVQAPNLIEN